MPVNMDPTKRRRKPRPVPEAAANPTTDSSEAREPKDFGGETEADRQKALADAESKNLWDATEVIDMDKW